MKTLPATRTVALALLAALAALLLSGCATAPDESDEPEPTYVPEELPPTATGDVAEEPEPEAEPTEPAPPVAPPPPAPPPAAAPPPEPRAEGPLTEVVVAAPTRRRDEVIRDLVVEARALLTKERLQYVILRNGRRETLRGRPVAFALWSEAKEQWTIAHIEIPRPPVKWRPGGRPLSFTVRTPGITARHVKGTGAERLMFAFTASDGEPLKVYGRKFPVFDDALIRKKRWRAVAQTARPIVYLPYTADTLDPKFVTGGKDFLLATAREAIEELRRANIPSRAYPDKLLADIVPAEVITTLAVIEQTDDTDFRTKGEEAFNEVLSQYGLKRQEAYRYSVSRARAIGPMQFTNRRGNGTYSLVVRRCPAARIDPDFERGATNLLNVMKAAICLFDIELLQMRADIRAAYRDNMKVLGIFPVAAYNGGPRNVTRLHRAMQRMGVNIEDLRAPGEQPEGYPVPCPCVWVEGPGGVQPRSIPRYNEENRWYIEKYQEILNVF
jgi:hypothetical protein